MEFALTIALAMALSSITGLFFAANYIRSLKRSYDRLREYNTVLLKALRASAAGEDIRKAYEKAKRFMEEDE